MILAAAFNETLSTQRTFGDIVAKIKAIFAGLAGVGNDLKPLKSKKQNSAGKEKVKMGRAILLAGHWARLHGPLLGVLFGQIRGRTGHLPMVLLPSHWVTMATYNMVLLPFFGY